jgi:hypothetical protein
MKSEKKILKIISNKTSINQKNGDQIWQIKKLEFFFMNYLK